MLAYIGRMSVRLVNTQRAMGQLMGVGMFRMGLWIGWDCGSDGIVDRVDAISMVRQVASRLARVVSAT